MQNDLLILFYELDSFFDIAFILFQNKDSMASDYPVRITVSSQESSRNFPIFVTARQQKGLFYDY